MYVIVYISPLSIQELLLSALHIAVIYSPN